MKSPKETIKSKLVEKHVNRTGIALSPIHAKELIEGAAQTQPSMSGDETGIATVRAAYMRDAEPIGSIPPPATAKGVAKTAAKALTGERVSVLLDKMGARLAFERTGTRLYQAIIGKVESGTPFDGGPSLERLTQIMREEQQHFEMLREAMEAMGGDPTAVTPAADVEATLSMGVPQVLHDARTDVHQSLEAILLAELADNDGWTMLIELARSLGQDELAEKFAVALAQEDEHLRDVRAWVKASTLASAGGKKARAGAPATR
ncbi:ferritin-like domain-containing protein [Sandaracinus amylolyticus]|uniref:Ferritin/DPS domain-containing protein n=1 Tax=Sandaracinus amylolyticus TaxID=927083 RepID=A0A0F6YGE3_9BACT|nr:ferritin-like domain-containing protein [Sandaracinus amylolyticus]AKF03857.1 Hypothetical protein DB32_001006 [Sandaracinus amylolyticus]